MLGAILQKLIPYRLPAGSYFDALQNKTLLPDEKKKLIHMLTTAIHQVSSTKQKQQLTTSLRHLKRLYTQEQQHRIEDEQEADLLLDQFSHDQ